MNETLRRRLSEKNRKAWGVPSLVLIDGGTGQLDAAIAARDESGALVGYTLFWHVVDEVHLLNVAVAVSARRQGLGRALMLDLVAYARAHGIVRILLEVRASNAPALALYESMGFTRFNVRPRYYSDGEDAIELQLLV